MRILGNARNWPALIILVALVQTAFVSVAVSLPEIAAAEVSDVITVADNGIRENNPTTTYGVATTLKVDGDDPGGSGKDAYSLLRWGLSSVPAGSNVVSASATVNVTNPSTQTYQIYDLRRPWVESTATWLQTASGSAWEVAGAKGSLDRGAQVGSVSPSVTGKRTFALSTSVVQQWIDNPSSNQGIVIANATNTDGFSLSSRQATDTNLRPTLSVNYSSSPSRYLSDMSWTSATSGWGPAEKNMSNGEQPAGDGRLITLNGVAFPKGLGVHASSDIRYSLAGAYSRFSAKVGVDDEVGALGSVVFEVWADGARLYSSGVMNGASPTKSVLLDIRGKNELRLVVTNGADSVDSDHADWAAAMVDNGAPPPADTDGDGVTDDVDQCINQPGPASNNGCPIVQPPATDPANVCAHWHVAAQREVSGANTVDAYVAELQKANAMGVECFAINVNGWDSNYQLHTTLLWDAANSWNNAHPSEKIYLYPSVDMASIHSEATFEAISRYKYDDPARLRVDGGVHGNNLPVTQTWLGNALFGGPSGWDRILDEEANAGKPVFFMPFFSGSVSAVVDLYNGANNTDPADDVIDGLYNFGGLSSGDNSESGYQQNQALVQAVSPGMDAQAGCAPNFNRHSDNGQFGNRIIGDFEGFHSFKKCMSGFAAEQKPRFMEFTTWNDYLEGSYLGGPYTPAQLPSTYDGNYFSHDAFRKLGRYYIDWFESGVQPTLGKDFVATAHRSHMENAPAVSGTTDSMGLVRQPDYAVVEDRLYAVVLLKSPGEIRITSGSTTQTFSQPAGASEVSMPFASGTQKIGNFPHIQNFSQATGFIRLIRAMNCGPGKCGRSWLAR